MPASNWQPPFSLSQEAELEFQDVFNTVAACCDFYAFGWMARQIAGDPPFQHFHTARSVTSSLVDCDAEFEKSSAMAG